MGGAVKTEARFSPCLPSHYWAPVTQVVMGNPILYTNVHIIYTYMQVLLFFEDEIEIPVRPRLAPPIIVSLRTHLYINNFFGTKR